jgi:hypothetical protein
VRLLYLLLLTLLLLGVLLRVLLLGVLLLAYLLLRQRLHVREGRRGVRTGLKLIGQRLRGKGVSLLRRR